MATRENNASGTDVEPIRDPRTLPRRGDRLMDDGAVKTLLVAVFVVGVAAGMAIIGIVALVAQHLRVV